MKRSDKMTKEEKTALRQKMEVMVKEANSLRDEAAEKMHEIPKGYKLYTTWDTVKFCLGILACGVLLLGAMWLFHLCLENEQYLPIVVLVLVLFYAMLVADAIRNRPYHVEEHMKDFYVNEFWYGKLEAEVNRLKAGIADYDRQYAEQEEYIEKFRQYTYTISELLGQSGDLELVRKAYDFHATLKLEVCEEKINLRLEFNNTDYEQMDRLTRQFSQKLDDLRDRRHGGKALSCAEYSG